MHPSVRAAWRFFSEPLEGRVPYLYADVRGLLTVGVGNLADPLELALRFPWTMPDGELATRPEVERQWHAIKAKAKELAPKHHRHAAHLTSIRLTNEDIDEVVLDKLDSNAEILARVFKGFAEYPADAQLGILSMAWAVGPGFPLKFPTFTRQALAGEWWNCATSSKIREVSPEGIANPGVATRNQQNRLCFENAANVIANNADRSVLHWPSKFQHPLATLEDAPPLSRDPDSTRLVEPSDLGAAHGSILARTLDDARAWTKESADEAMREADDEETTKPDRIA
ncbi:MAG TPA: hypothetical protein VFR23_24570 [Jiangellaceae bacterium]|nr:hypothetical protein [Jiangellaceae bacterium]